MLLELVIILPFLVLLVVLGLGHDITDTQFIETMSRERQDNADTY